MDPAIMDSFNAADIKFADSPAQPQAFNAEDIKFSENNAVNDEPAPAQPQKQLADTESFDNPVFRAVARGGAAINDAVQSGLGDLAEWQGKTFRNVPILGNPATIAAGLTPLATAADLLLPKTQEAAGMGALLGGADTSSRAMVPGSTPEDLSIKQPNILQKIGGQIATSTTAIPERYTSAVMANPDILQTAETPREVGNDYQQVFEKYGLKFDSDFVKEITGKRYIPGETQTGQGYKIIDDLLSKYKDADVKPSDIPANEAFLGRSVAASLKRSNQYLTNPTFKSVVDGAQSYFDSALEENGMPEFKQLGQRYFRAVAKEYFDSALPQNKNMSPNALRSVLMLKMGSDALGQLIQGNGAAAAGKALQAASMSPMLVGSAIDALANGPAVSNAAIGGAAAATYAKLNNPIEVGRYAPGLPAYDVMMGKAGNYQATPMEGPKTPNGMNSFIRNKSNPFKQ